MKKQLLLTLALFMVAVGAIAQNVESKISTKRNQSKHHSATSFQQKKNLAKFGQNDSSDWYGVLDMMSKSDIGLAGSLKYFVNFMNNDTLIKFIDIDGLVRNPWIMSAGHILDPTDDIIDLSDGNPKPENKLSRFNSYTLDSILFRYLYVRNVETMKDANGVDQPVVDTVFVAYWKGAQIRKSSFTDSTRYALPIGGWDTITRMPANCFKIDTFLLNSGVNNYFDTTRAISNGGFENSWSSKYAQLAAPKGMDYISDGNKSDNLVAFTVTYKSGIPSVIQVKSDSTLKTTPSFLVNGNQVDSISYSSNPTYTNFFNNTLPGTDSTLNPTIQIVRFDVSNPTTPSDTLSVYKADYFNYTFDTAGTVIDSAFIASTATLRLQQLPYYTYNYTNDTAVYIDQRDPATVTKAPRRTNYFGFGFESNSGTTGWNNTVFYNTPMFAYGFASYASFRGWRGYIVSQAFASGEDFLDCYFNLRIQGSVKAGIEDGNHIAITGLFPNPATKSTAVRFDLKSNSDVTVSVHNILGQEMMVKDLGNVGASIYEYNMDLSSLTPGIYTVSVKAGKTTQTQRLMVTE